MRERLHEAGLDFSERDFFARPLTRAELEKLARLAGGVRVIFAFGSPAFRKLDRATDSFTDAELLDLLESEPRYLRRPLAVRDGKVHVGGRAVSNLAV